MKNTKVVGCKAERPTLLLSAVLNARGRATRRAPQPPPAPRAPCDPRPQQRMKKNV